MGLADVHDDISKQSAPAGKGREIIRFSIFYYYVTENDKRKYHRIDA